MLLYLRMAFRNIFRQRRRTWFTGVTIAGGFVLLSLMIGIDKGGYDYIINMFTKGHTGHVQVHHPEFADRPRINLTLPHDQTLAQNLQQDPRILGATARIRSGGLAYFEPKSLPVSIVGIEPNQEAELTTLSQRVQNGQYFDSTAPIGDTIPALINSHAARVLGLSLGDDLAVISQSADGSVANDLFTIIGILAGEDGPDRQAIYISLEDAQEFFMLHGRIHEWMIQTRGPHLAYEVAGSLQDSPKFVDALVRPWQELEREFYTAMQADRKGNRVVNLIIMLMVALGVLNTVFMLILERTREYGILKALGTRPRIILGLIVLETTLLTALAVTVGAILSLPVHYYFSQHGIMLSTPFDLGGIQYDRIISTMSPSVVLQPALYLFLMVSIVSILPAWRAARKDPLASINEL